MSVFSPHSPQNKGVFIDARVHWGSQSPCMPRGSLRAAGVWTGLAHQHTVWAGKGRRGVGTNDFARVWSFGLMGAAHVRQGGG
jgi:hypothetical protein